MRTVVLVALLGGLLMLPGRAFVLVSDGKTEAVIVLPAEPSAVEETAASELTHFLEEATGARLPVVRGTAPDGPCIVLGTGGAFAEAFPEVDVDALGRDAIVLKTQSDRLYLAGQGPRGTLYAVYTFLEDTVGVRWWSATESHVPDRPTLGVPPLDVLYAPRIVCREAFYRGAFDGVFAARLKLNGHHMQVPPEFGGHYRILGWCHTFNQLLPPEEYFDAHPEWYSEIDGRRVKDHTQLCLTNEAARRALTEKALAWIRNDPDAGMISISQNDWHNRCQCADCRALEEAQGGPSGPLLHFVNAVAEDIEREFPDVLVCTLAYQYTRQAPRHVRPRKNVVVRLCSIECDFSEPLATGARNADFKRDIEAWSAIADQLYIWDYVTNFRNLILPHPNFQVLAPNIRFFADHNAIGLFEQGDAGSSCSDFPELRAWLFAHLMWDPSRDQADLTREFIGGYYGAAAPPLLRYLALLEDAIAASGGGLRCYEESTARWLNLDQLNEATRFFDAAEAALQGDEMLLNRVQRARMPLDHVWLNRYDGLKRQAKRHGLPFLGPEDPAAFAKAFVERAEAFDVGWYREAQPFSAYAPVLLNRFRAPGPPPEALKDADPDTYVDAQEHRFSLHGVGDWVSLTEDAKASDGMAARVRGGHTQWAVQLPVTMEMEELGRARCAVVLRCAAPGDAGPALRAGIWNSAANQPVTETALSVENLESDGYTVVDLGSWDLKDGMYFWVAPDAGLRVDGAVWVDRIYCVKD